MTWRNLLKVAATVAKVLTVATNELILIRNKTVLGVFIVTLIKLNLQLNFALVLTPCLHFP